MYLLKHFLKSSNGDFYNGKINLNPSKFMSNVFAMGFFFGERKLSVEKSSILEKDIW
jgi:hypothetical protein